MVKGRIHTYIYACSFFFVFFLAVPAAFSESLDVCEKQLAEDFANCDTYGRDGGASCYDDAFDAYEECYQSVAISGASAMVGVGGSAARALAEVSISDALNK